ncbi:MAG: hypothetical protein QM699_09890 [Amaricoccus sp.]
MQAEANVMTGVVSDNSVRPKAEYRHEVRRPDADADDDSEKKPPQHPLVSPRHGCPSRQDDKGRCHRGGNYKGGNDKAYRIVRQSLQHGRGDHTFHRARLQPRVASKKVGMVRINQIAV